MKHLELHRVNNGWIVVMCDKEYRGESDGRFVFETLEGLTKFISEWSDT